MAEVAADHSPEWQGLGVSILHRLIVDTLLDRRACRLRSTFATSTKSYAV